MSEIQEEFDAFTSINSEIPFALSAFVRNEMESTLRRGLIPVVLVFRVEGKIKGIAPLSIVKKYGIRSVTSLFDFEYSPDFVLDAEHANVCLEFFFRYIFENLKCQIVNLALPAESASWQILELVCKKNRFFMHRKSADPHLSHSVLHVNGSWEAFQKARGGNFRHHFRGIKRKLDAIGPWSVTLSEDVENEKALFGRMLDIENASWKQEWREQHEVQDYFSDLSNAWEGGGWAAKNCPGFKRIVWFLELNEKAIAYSLVLQYKKTAYIVKTSYSDKYRKLYPSIYTMNEGIKNLFDSGKIDLIDFLTNLPFMKRWTLDYKERINVSLWKNTLIGLLIRLPEVVPLSPNLRKKLRGFLP
jgi:hypothetical protein